MHPDLTHIARWPRSLHDVALWLTVILPVALLAGGTVGDIVISIIAALFLLHSLRHRDWQWTKAAWVKLVLALWVYMMLRGIFTPEPQDAIGRSLVWIRYPLFGAALAYWVLREEAARRMLWVATAVYAFFLAGDSIVQFFLGHDVFGQPIFVMPSGEQRLTGPFTGPKSGIMLVWLLFPALLPLLMTEGRLAPPRRLLAGIVLALGATLAIVLAGERMALLLILLGFALTFLLLPIPRRITGAVAVLSVLVVALVLHQSPTLRERHVETVIDTVKRIEHTPYGQIWQSGVNIFHEHVLFGAGPRHFRVLCPEPRFGPTHNLQWRCNLHPHNMYLEALVETGLIGMTLFLVMIAALLAPLIRAWPWLRRDAMYLGLLITAIIRFWPLAVTTSFYANWFAVTLWLALGWGLAVAERAK